MILVFWSRTKLFLEIQWALNARARKKLQFPNNIDLAIARKRLKRWVYAAMRLTSIESSFHPCNRGVPREAKMCKKRAKMANFWTYGLNYCIGNGWDRWVHAAMRLTSTESSFHVTFTAIVPGAYPGEAKMCLRLITEIDARSVGDSHPSCFVLVLWIQSNKAYDWQSPGFTKTYTFA